MIDEEKEEIRKFYSLPLDEQIRLNRLAVQEDSNSDVAPEIAETLDNVWESYLKGEQKVYTHEEVMKKLMLRVKHNARLNRN